MGRAIQDEFAFLASENVRYRARKQRDGKCSVCGKAREDTRYKLCRECRHKGWVRTQMQMGYCRLCVEGKGGRRRDIQYTTPAIKAVWRHAVVGDLCQECSEWEKQPKVKVPTARLHKCCWLRVRCDVCGFYDLRMATRPKNNPTNCDHCGRGELQLIGVATGKTTEVVPWVGKPHKYSVDWIQGGNRRSGKSTGRPKNVQPNDVQDRANDRAGAQRAHPDDGGVDLDDADGGPEPGRDGVDVPGGCLLSGVEEEPRQPVEGGGVAGCAPQYL